VDLRGEVLLLSKNIKIIGEDFEAYGCQMVTSDTVEYDGITNSLKYRTGMMILDNVEMYNCSQQDTFKSALRFENALTLPSSITNCTFHNGLGWGVSIKRSANILFQDNILYNFRPIGFRVSYSKNVTVDNNVVSKIVERLTFGGGGFATDRRAAYTICAFEAAMGEMGCEAVVTNNIAAGAPFAGFLVAGHDCGDYANSKFKNNVAHSIWGGYGGHGAMIFPDPNKPHHYE
jgi:hypothetical protein